MNSSLWANFAYKIALRSFLLSSDPGYFLVKLLDDTATFSELKDYQNVFGDEPEVRPFHYLNHCSKRSRKACIA